MIMPTMRKRPPQLWKMTSRSKWYSELSSAEKLICNCTNADQFFRYCSIYIDRYAGNSGGFFAARNAYKAIFEGAPIPLGADSQSAEVRVDRFNLLKEYAMLRGMGCDRNGAIGIMNLGA